MSSDPYQAMCVRLRTMKRSFQLAKKPPVELYLESQPWYRIGLAAGFMPTFTLAKGIP